MCVCVCIGQTSKRVQWIWLVTLHLRMLMQLIIQNRRPISLDAELSVALAAYQFFRSGNLSLTDWDTVTSPAPIGLKRSSAAGYFYRAFWNVKLVLQRYERILQAWRKTLWAKQSSYGIVLRMQILVTTSFRTSLAVGFGLRTIFCVDSLWWTSRYMNVALDQSLIFLTLAASGHQANAS